MRFSAIAVIFILSYVHIHAQYNPVTINVKDDQNITVPGAAVTLVNQRDSSVLNSVSDQFGKAILDQVRNDLYGLRVSFIGFSPVDTIVNITPQNRTFDFTLSTEAIMLGEVSIEGRRPLMRQEEDKMIIDPSPIANIASNTLEVLESTPGLFVDQEGGIFITGATPATIYINGREQKMSNQDIATILRSLPPNSVDRIEVIRTPSARYEASSSGGIINIILKKGVKIGRFGSVNFRFNRGFLNRSSAGASFNNSGPNSTSYINVNFSNNDNLEDLSTIRYLQQDSSINQKADVYSNNKPVYLGYGINYDISPKINFAYDGRLNITRRYTISDNNNFILASDAARISESTNKLESKSGFVSLQQDAGIIVKIDTLGSELDTKLSYSYNRNNADQDFSLDFTIPARTGFSGLGDNFQNMHFLVLQSDLTYTLWKNLKLETGFKTSVQSFDSDSDYSLILNGIQIQDPERTNAYKYLQNINAAYFQLSRPLFAGFHLKAGLRAEHSYMNGRQTIPADTSFLQNRTDLFPYIYFSRVIFTAFGFDIFGYAIYRKTINRPGYQQLNPYNRYVDQFLYETGNPSLLPQLTNNIEFNISVNDFPLFAIGRNKTHDIFSTVMYNDMNNDKVLLRTYDNVGTSNETYIRGIIATPPTGKAFLAFGAQYNYLKYDGIYENEPWQFSNGSWRMFAFSYLNIARDTRLTLSGFMMTKGIWNFYELETIGQLNIGLTQTFMNKKLTVTVNARDILKTMDIDFLYNQGSIRSSGTRKTDTRWAGINIRYNFGIDRKKEDRSQMPQFQMPEL